jgi:hypothetical protein
MTYIAAPLNNHLAHELDRLGVPFIRTGAEPASPASLPPASLLAGLAASDEARLRLALIPLLLVHPEFAPYAPETAAQLPPPAHLRFACYYTAAVLLQQLQAERIQHLLGNAAPLPDLFSAELGVPTAGAPAERLAALAARHATLSGEPINWLGTYQHAAERLLRHGERLRGWTG